MAGIRSSIDLIITGSTRGLNAAAAQARATAERIASAEDRVAEARRRSAEAESRVAETESRLSGARAQQQAALSRIGVAETNLANARQASLGQTTRLAQAQADLDAVRNNAGSTAEQVAAAEERVTRVRQEADTAAQRLQRAEAQLETARANADRSSSRVRAAEEALARARGQAFRASEDLARSETRLGLLRRRGNDDINRQRTGIAGVFDAFSRLSDAFTGADGASTSLLAKMSALNSVFTTIGGPIVQAVIGLAEFAAIAGAVVEIIGVVGGLIGQVLGGALPILFALGAAAGAVALGMDGVKKAAQVAAPAFERLKASVSGVFAREMLPGFRELAQILPRLAPGLQAIAGAVSAVFNELVRQVARGTDGLANLKEGLFGTAQLVNALAPGLSEFLNGFLNAVARAAPAMAALGTAVGSIFARIGDVLNRLANNGVIQAAVQGLAATITGLGAVIAPVIELLIRMGAALGNSLGVALQGVGSGIQQVIPFFERLAQVAGQVLVDAFQQLGPPLRELVDSILPGAGAGLDGFASLMHNVVLPAIAGFINWIRTDGIPGIVAFTQGLIVNMTSAASQVLGFVSTMLGALRDLFTFLAVATNNPFFLKLAGDAEVARGKVDGFKAGVDALHDKTVQLQLKTVGAQEVQAAQTAINGVKDKVVKVISNVFGQKENEGLKSAIDAVPNKTTTTTSNVIGEQANRTLTAAIDAVHDTTKTSLSNVFGEPQNRSLKSAIDAVYDKTVSVRANVFGEAAVRALVSAIDAVHDASATVTTYVRQIFTNAEGGVMSPRPAIGMAGGGNLTPMSGRYARIVAPNTWRVIGDRMINDEAFIPINQSARSRKILALTAARMGWDLVPAGMAAGGALSPGGPSSSAGGSSPVQVRVFIGDQELKGMVRTEINARDRATKRTVLAGPGVTF